MSGIFGRPRWRFVAAAAAAVALGAGMPAATATGDEAPDRLAIPVFEVLPGGAVREVPMRTPPHTLLAGRQRPANGREGVLSETEREVTAVDVVGNRVVTTADCHLLDSTVDIAVPACRHITDLDVAPDGRLAAVVYERPGQLRLRIVDLDPANVLTDIDDRVEETTVA